MLTNAPTAAAYLSRNLTEEDVRKADLDYQNAKILMRDKFKSIFPEDPFANL